MQQKLYLLVIFLLSGLLNFAQAQEAETCIHHVVPSEGLPTRRDDLPYTRESTYFRVHFDNQIQSAIVDSVLTFAEYSRQKQCTQFNWQVPPADDGRGGNNKYDIYLLYNGDAYNGQTFPEVAIGSEDEGAPTFIELYRNFNLSETSVLKMIIAHEFNHACQIGYSYNESKTTWFYENTAVFMAEKTWDYFINYYTGYFTDENNPISKPELSITTANAKYGLYHYCGFLWPQFLAEWKNFDIIRQIWYRFNQNKGAHLLEDIDYVLTNSYSSNIEEALKTYAEWRYFTGSRNDNLHFSHIPASVEPAVEEWDVSAPIQLEFSIHGYGGTKFIKIDDASGYLCFNIEHWSEAGIPWTGAAVKITPGIPCASSPFSVNSSGYGKLYQHYRNNFPNMNATSILFTPIVLTGAEIDTYPAAMQTTNTTDELPVLFMNEAGGSNAGGEIVVNGTDHIASGSVVVYPANTVYSEKTSNERFTLSGSTKKHKTWNNVLPQFLMNKNFFLEVDQMDQVAKFEPFLPPRFATW